MGGLTAQMRHSLHTRRFESTPPEPTIRIFVDFDGTMLPEDVGEHFFLRFGDRAMVMHLVERMIAGEIHAEEMYHAMAATMRGLDQEALGAFADEFSVDPTFRPFTQWAERHGYPLLIVSDGMDFYIDRLLEKEGLSIPHRSNTLVLDGEGGCRIEFPWARCHDRGSANCKRNHVVLSSQDDDRIVYIGNGASDYDAARYADLVFARGSLETHCQQENITFRRFFTFLDVKNIIEDLLRRGLFRRPRQAELRRRQLWSTG